jgi:LAO/AO transport system kinase
MRPFYVYMLRCGDGSYYTGHTDDIDQRMQQHGAGDIGYTSTRKPVELVWQGEFETREGALAFEQQIKGWSRAKKEALMAADWPRISELAKSSQGLRQAQPERSGAQPERSGAQPERSGAQPERSRAQPERELVDGVLQHQRRAIAKAITLLESTRADHREQADELLTALLPHTGKSFRLGISGVPGVGKSTFIEALGLFLIDQGHRVAVLTIDPSSTVSGGSILGDKTRMEKLSVHEMAYIRPSPSSGTLGGVAEKTREAMLVCEAAGYDVVIVETVGVGQSEIAVSGMTDMFVLMQLPNAGDDLQAIKKGVMELADLVVINKADLDADAATRAQAQITSALRLFGQHGNPDHAHHHQGLWHPTVTQLSALTGDGVDRFWHEVERFRRLQSLNGRMASRRQQQSLSWMWERIEAGLRVAFRQNPQVRSLLPALTAEVAQGRVAASTAARRLLDAASLHAVRAEPKNAVRAESTNTVRAEPVEAHANVSASPSTGSGRTES